MTGLELAEALRRVAALIEGQTRVAGLCLEVAPGATLRVRSGAAERQARHRETRRSNADVTQDARHSGITKPVTECDTAELPPPHTPSPFVLPSEITEKTPEGRTDHAHEAEAEPSDAPVTQSRVTRVDLTDSETHSRCPLDLAERATKLEVDKDLAVRLKQPIEVIRAAMDEFVSYWTFGGGMGQSKARWMRQLREHIRKSAASGKLPALGAVQHAANAVQANGLPAGWNRHPTQKGWFTDETGATRRSLPRAS